MDDDPLSPAALSKLWHDEADDAALTRRLRKTLRHAAAENGRLRAQLKDATTLVNQQKATIAAQKLVIDRLVDGAAGRTTIDTEDRS